ncbi:MAG: hypothetical protein AB1714_17265 [Acidobacteriota bacterium]
MRALTRGWREEAAHVRLLARGFFRRFFENELVSRDGTSGLTVVHLLALLALPSVLMPFLLMLKYMDVVSLMDLPPEMEPRTWTDKAFFISYAMSVVGFLTVAEWDALFLNRRDFHILGCLPLRARTIFAGKLAALLFFPAVFILDTMNIGPLMVPALLMPGASPGEMARYVIAHVAAVSAGGFFAFFLLLAVQAVLINLLGHRHFRRVSPYVQFASFWLYLSFLTLCPKALARFGQSRDSHDLMVRAFPPMWFFGMFQHLSGQKAPEYAELHAIGLTALALVTSAAVLGYVAAYARGPRRMLEHREATAAEPPATGTGLTRLLDRILLRTQLDRAIFRFVTATTLRSPTHRLVLVGYVGVGFALALDGVLATLSHRELRLNRPTAPLLSVQLLLSFFLLSGLRLIFALPAEVRANWVFRLTETGERGRYISAVRKSLHVYSFGLLCVLLSPLYVILWGAQVASLHLLFGLAASSLLIELLLCNFRKIPFTCAYLPGKARITSRWPLYWLAFASYGYWMAEIEEKALAHSTTATALVVLALVSLSAAVRRWSDRSQHASHMVFEEEPEPAMDAIDLKG